MCKWVCGNKFKKQWIRNLTSGNFPLELQSYSVKLLSTHVKFANIQISALILHVSIKTTFFFFSELSTLLWNLSIANHDKHLTAKQLFLKSSFFQWDRAQGSIWGNWSVCFSYSMKRSRHLLLITKQCSLKWANGKIEALSITGSR